MAGESTWSLAEAVTRCRGYVGWWPVFAIAQPRLFQAVLKERSARATASSAASLRRDMRANLDVRRWRRLSHFGDYRRAFVLLVSGAESAQSVRKRPEPGRDDHAADGRTQSRFYGAKPPHTTPPDDETK